MTEPRTVLFFYGTLKRGQRNHALIRDERFLGEAVTAPKYRLVDLGPYLGLVRDEAHGVAVRGELWEVSACVIGELDDFEGVPELYTRGPVEIVGAEGVEAYFDNRPVSAGTRSGAEWPSA
jgi:gamma-glutamylaminecyclotransferase